MAHVLDRNENKYWIPKKCLELTIWNVEPEPHMSTLFDCWYGPVLGRWQNWTLKIVRDGQKRPRFWGGRISNQMAPWLSTFVGKR